MVHENALGSSSYSLTIEVPGILSGLENEENRAMFDSLRDNFKLLVKHYLPLVCRYLSVLTKTGGPEEVIRSAIDRKTQVLRYKEKCELLGISISVDEQKEDLIDEEVFVEIEPVAESCESFSSKMINHEKDHVPMIRYQSEESPNVTIANPLVEDILPEIQCYQSLREGIK